MANEKLQLRYSDEELSWINGAFCSGNVLLLVIRNFLLQKELTAKEQTAIDNLDDKLIAILKKTYLPALDFTAPIGQIVDNWSLVNTKDRDLDMFNYEVQARGIIIDYFLERFETMAGGKDPEVKIQFADLFPSSNKDVEDNFIELTARNMILSGVESNTAQLWILAGDKIETPEETKTRLFKDSSK